MNFLRDESYPEDLETAFRLSLSDEMVERVDRILLVLKERLQAQMQVHTPTVCSPLPTLPWSIEEMRLSPIGQDVLAIAAYADWKFRYKDAEVRRAIKRLYSQLFGNAFSEGYKLPDDFYKSELGSMIDKIYWRMYGYKAWVGPTEASRELGVSRQSIYDGIKEGWLLAIHWPPGRGDLRVLRDDLLEWKDQREHQRKVKERAARRKRGLAMPDTEEMRDG